MVARLCMLHKAPASAISSPVDWPKVPPIGQSGPPTPEFLQTSCGKPFQVDGSSGRLRLYFHPANTAPGIYEFWVSNVQTMDYVRGPRVVIVSTAPPKGPGPAAAASAPPTSVDVMVGQNEKAGALDPELPTGSNARPITVETITQPGTNVAYFVVGGVIGGAAIAVAAIFAWCLWRRRQNRKRGGITVQVTRDDQGREIITIRRPDGGTVRGALAAPGANASQELEAGAAAPEGKLPPSPNSSGEHVSSPSFSSVGPSQSASEATSAPARSRGGPRDSGGPALSIAAGLVASQQQDASELFSKAVCTKCLRVNPGCASEEEAADAACRYCRLPLVVNRRFFPVARVGGGEFGTTFAAVDLHFLSRRRCIVKKFTFVDHHFNDAHVEKAAQLFLDEGRTLENLDHPRIPKLLGSFIWLQDMYHAMAEVRGLDLQRALRARVAPFARAEALAMLSDLLGALGYVHARGVIHRDVKPSNVIVGEDGRYYLVDFGLSTTRRPDLDQATEIGTYAYADPEQRAGRPTPSSDLYSLAATCVEMMTRRRPALELFCDWEPGRCPEGDFGAELGAALARMLRRSVAGRFAAAADAAEALFGPARALPAGPGPTAGNGTAPSPPPAPTAPPPPSPTPPPSPAPTRPAATPAALDPSGIVLEEKARPRRRAAGPALAPTLESGSASEEEGSGSEEEGGGSDPPEAPPDRGAGADPVEPLPPSPRSGASEEAAAEAATDAEKGAPAGAAPAGLEGEPGPAAPKEEAEEPGPGPPSDRSRGPAAGEGG
eukprot:tig00000826_g4585.t1